MSKVAVVYWSGSGNTEAMANAVVSGAQSKGATVDLIYCTDFNSAKAGEYDAVALGCPAMGSEVLEEGEFQPMFDEVASSLAGKKVALFGSYGWGSGEWMESWEADCASAGISLATDSVMANNEPDGEAIASCEALGAALA